jgi:hypothetical protein
MSSEIIPFPLKKRDPGPDNVRLDIIKRLTDIGSVLHIPDAEILHASADFSQLLAFSRRYNQSLNWIIFGNPDEMIMANYLAKPIISSGWKKA